MDPSATSTTSISGSELERQLVVFSLHGESYGMPITSVREIIRYTTPGATGAANGSIKGMISLRGHILPVVDFASRIGRTTELNDATKILVIELNERTFGLVVDSVDEVLLVPAEAIEQIPVSDAPLGDQIAKLDDRLITIVDPDRALGRALAG